MKGLNKQIRMNTDTGDVYCDVCLKKRTPKNPIITVDMHDYGFSFWVCEKCVNRMHKLLAQSAS
jgi:hypothetical protein